MWNTSFVLALCLCFVSQCGVCFATFDVVCDEFDNGVIIWECVYVACVECFAHV